MEGGQGVEGHRLRLRPLPSSVPVSSLAPARGSFLLSFCSCRSPGVGTSGWGTDLLCIVGNRCTYAYTAGAEVSVCPSRVDVPM